MRDFLWNWAYGFFMYMIGSIVMDIHMRHTEKTIELIPTAKAIPLEAVEQIRAEIESNIEPIVGKYDTNTPEHDRPLSKCARNEARKECIEIIDKAIKEQKE